MFKQQSSSSLWISMIAVCASWQILTPSSVTRADIFNWQTGQVIPGTEGITLGPGAGIDLSFWNTDSHNLRYADLSGISGFGWLTRFDDSWLDFARFNGTNLAGVDLDFATLANADFTDATISGAYLAHATWNGFTKEQLYSTASYKSKTLTLSMPYCHLDGWDLSGQNMRGSNLSAGNLSHANLRGANLSYSDLDTDFFDGADLREANLSHADLTWAPLINANLRQANLTNARFLPWDYPTFANADLSLADLRGATDLPDTSGAASLRNTIVPDGSINRLGLLVGDELPVHNHTLPILAKDSMTMVDGSILHMLFSDPTWGSTIKPDTGVIPVLGGTLELSLEAGADPNQLVGATFHLFDWNGQLPPGSRFSQITTSWWLTWDTSQLYTSGDVTLLAVPEPAMVVLLALSGAWLVRRKSA